MTGKANKPNYTQLTDTQLTPLHYFYQKICINLLKIYFAVKYDLHVWGKQENQPQGYQSYIVAANHMSSLDPPLVSVALYYQPISYMGKIELFEKPLMRWYNQAMSTFAVNREKLEISTVKTALKVLKHGQWALGIFPEGTRRKDGTPGEAKRGVAYFAKASGKPILPVAIAHTTPAKGRKRIDVQIGKLIPPEEDMDALTQKIQQTLLDLADEARSHA